MEEEKSIKTYSVSLHLDTESTLFITSLIEDIAAATGNSYRKDKGIVPHITVGMFKALKDRNSFISMCLPFINNLCPFSVEIEKFEILKGKILYASLSNKDKFKEIEKGLFDILSNNFRPCSNNLYSPDIFLPHITLATGLSNKQKEEALKVIHNIQLPRKIYINRIVLAITKPYEIIFEK